VSLLTLIFVLAALLTAIAAVYVVRRMAGELKRIAPTERRVSFPIDLPGILREHQRAFPQSDAMLAFWLCVMFLLVWLASIAFSCLTHG